jgi:hypothetical protein
MLAIAWLTALGEETEKAMGLHALYNNGIAVVSGK